MRLLFCVLGSLLLAATASAATVRGRVIDQATGLPLPARVYIENADGEWFYPVSASPKGTAIRYDVQRRNESFEHHTTLSAHPFEVRLQPGHYTFTVVRGKEFHELRQEVFVKKQELEITLPLRRWINLPERGWYSGDTHVHRGIEDLPNLMLAEDLNVTFPLTYWVTKAFIPPSRGGKNTADPGAELIPVDDTHVIWPRNTEYEIFTVNGQRHPLGAVFVLGHRKVLDFGAPPVSSIAVARNMEGAPLLDLDKHNWPWSMAIVPLLKVNLYELSNNHIWRTKFAFDDWAEMPAEYMQTGGDGTHGGEAGWREFGFRNYYALLNCGFRITPTAGTANGVHPVPLGFGRVYVHQPDGFNYDQWRRGLKRGRSFVTTGPMLFATLNDEVPGYKWKATNRQMKPRAEFAGEVLSAHPLTRIEILFNGRVVKTIQPANNHTDRDAFASAIAHQTRVEKSGWFVVRCYERRPDGRLRFAHSGPWHFEIPGKPLRPRKEEINYLIKRVADQIERSRKVLPPAAIAEYEKALAIYQEIAKTAR